MASELAGMAPLEHSGPHRIGYEEPVTRTIAWTGFCLLGPFNLRLDVHGDHPYDTRSRDNGLRLGRGLLGGMQSRQSVSLGVTGARPVGKGIVESVQELCPPCLARVEALGSTDEGQVLMVRPNKCGVFGTLQPVAPLLKGCHHS